MREMLREILAVAGQRRGFQPLTDGGLADDADAARRNRRYDFEIEQDKPPLVRVRGKEQFVELAGDIGPDRAGSRSRRGWLSRSRSSAAASSSAIGMSARRGFSDRGARLKHRMRAQRRGNVGQIRGQALNDPQRRREMARQPRCHGGARRHIDRFEQPQRKLGVMPLLVGRVRELLHVEVGEDAQQCRPHIDPAAQSQTGEVVEAR